MNTFIVGECPFGGAYARILLGGYGGGSMVLSHRLEWKKKRSRNQAREMVLVMAMYGHNQINLNRDTPLSSEDEVIRLFEQNGFNFDRVVEESRLHDSAVPFVENLVGSIWYMSGEQGVETIVTSNYEGSFETAIDHLMQAVTNQSFGDVESAIVRGISSIEAFIAYHVRRWNEAHPDDQLIDSRDKKVSFDTKIDEWIPKMTGLRLNKGGEVWSAFKRLRAIRDNLTVHPKSERHSVTFHEMAELINLFRIGIADFLIELHFAFRHFIPCKIIAAAYETDVVVVKASAPPPG
ncbi:MAG: hypothetical protein L0229_24010 [Blastocatellia bacterium]|nr:hypothetical protein [Blastocatellia bacterium]